MRWASVFRVSRSRIISWPELAEKDDFVCGADSGTAEATEADRAAEKAAAPAPAALPGRTEESSSAKRTAPRAM